MSSIDKSDIARLTKAISKKSLQSPSFTPGGYLAISKAQVKLYTIFFIAI